MANNSLFIGQGDVTGPASSTDNAIALFNGTTGKLLKEGAVYPFPSTFTTGDLLYANSTTTVTGLAAVAAGKVLISAGTGTAPAYSANVVLTGGTVTTSSPLISGSQTWNDGAVSFIGTTYAYTETGSAAGSIYFRILGGAAGATTEFSVAKGGATTVNGSFNAGGNIVSNNGAILASASNVVGWSGLTLLSAPSDGAVKVHNNAQNGTSSFIIGAYLSGARSTISTMQSLTTVVNLSGATSSTGNVIPAGSTVVAVATTTTTIITGATGYQVGDGSDADRYGDITGTAVGTASGSTNYTADPTWWTNAARAIVLTAKTSNFTGGVVQVTVFYRTATGA